MTNTSDCYLFILPNHSSSSKWITRALQHVSLFTPFSRFPCSKFDNPSLMIFYCFSTFALSTIEQLQLSYNRSHTPKKLWRVHEHSTLYTFRWRNSEKANQAHYSVVWRWIDFRIGLIQDVNRLPLMYLRIQLSPEIESAAPRQSASLVA